MSLLWILLFYCFCESLSYNVSKEYIENLIKHAMPGHMELDPKYQHIFQNECDAYDTSESSRIAGGGWESVPHSRPYQAGIYTPTPTGGTSFCGGSLITNQVVLTAAHCITSVTGVMLIYLGAHGMPPPASDNAQLYLSSQYLLHPEWNTLTLQNDVALIYLREPVTLNERIQTISLATDASDNFLGRPTLVSGWGRPGDGTTAGSPVLREVTSRVISNVACRLAYMSTVQRNHICTSGEERRSTCRGDSGGALVVDGVQVGIVSFGIGSGCEVGWPPAHARITSYAAWINANLVPPTLHKT